MRVCLFGLYGDDNPRNSVLKRGLAAAGVDVVECRELLRLGETPSLLPVSRTVRLVQSFRRMASTIDAVVLPEFNQALVPLAVAICRPHGIPVICDFLVSLYDTAVRDRGQRSVRPRSMLLWLADLAALRLATRVIADTEANSRFYVAKFGKKTAGKITVIQVGAPEWLFQPSPLPFRTGRPLNVLFYGSFIPLHGADQIVAAADILKDDPRFAFILVGSGQTLNAVRAGSRGGRVQFRGAVALAEVPTLVRHSDICLGVFGTTGKAQRVVPNKVWQCMAAGRPTITGDNPATRAVFENGVHCLLVPHGDPQALVEALLRLADDESLATRVASDGASLVHSRFTSAALGGQLAILVNEVLGS